MGVIKQGILGPFSGKVGTVVGAIWKGIGTIRALPASVSNPRTEGQVNQRTKFSAALEFLQPSLAFIQQGFRFYAKGMSAFNAAQSYVLKNAITGTAPNFSVDYTTALVSRGKLEGVSGGNLSELNGTVTVTWTDNSNQGNARADDKVLLLVYNPTKGESHIVLEDPATREDATIVSTLPAHYSGDTVHVYLAFQAADGSMVSNSDHVGSVAVT